jgi:glucokinase
MAVIGIDLGGTKINAAIFDEEGEILYRTSHFLGRRKGNEVGRLIVNTVDELTAQSKCPVEKLHALGICVPGIADRKRGSVWAPNIDGWENYPLQNELEKNFYRNSVKICIDSDRTCYILGEKWRGVAKKTENAVFISVGTGIGVGMLVDGKIVHGYGDIVGAIGWFAMETPYLAEFEKYGCFESFASGDGIARHARRILSEKQLFPESILSEKEPEKITSRDVFEAYNINDPLAIFVIDKAIDFWARASANLVSLLNPELIIWGGGVFGPAAHLLDRIYREAVRWAQPIAIRQVRFEKSVLQGDAGLYGAGYLALSSISHNYL